jgi:tetratricopeptide (TPR) repeat protein/energy-coupling factor transporter ATP-binding protein EcfA2
MSDFKTYDAVVHEAAALPVMLPPKLIGREAALAQVYAHLKENRAVLVHGNPGVGKTALAATLASAYAQQPSGVLWLNVDEDLLESLLVRVGRSYDLDDVVNSDNPTAMVGAVGAALTQHKPLLVLDGKIDAQVASKFISRCADQLPVIIASRNAIEGPWASVELDVLEPQQAVQMYKSEAALTDDTSDQTLLSLVEALSRLPFAIAVASRAMLASKQAPQTYSTTISQAKNTTGGDSSAAALTSSFANLNGALQGLMLIMGATPRGEASADLISMVSGAPVESIQQAMTLLSQLRLVEHINRYGEAYYRQHPITHDFTRSRLRLSNRLDDLEAKVRDAILAYANRYAQASDPQKLAVELSNFNALARWGTNNHQRDIVTQLVGSLNSRPDFVNTYGLRYELSRMRGGATAFPAYPPEAGLPPEDELIPDLDAEDDADAAVGMLSRDDEDDDFIDEEDLDNELYEDVEDEDEDFDEDDDLDKDDDFDDELDEEDGLQPRATAAAIDDEDDLDDLADVEDDRFIDEEDDRYEPVGGTGMTPPPAALPVNDLNGLRTALAQARQAGDRAKQVEVLRAMGSLQNSQRMHTEALTTYSEALTLYEALDDQEHVLEMLDMLSALMVKTENAQAAVLNAGRGLKLAEELGDTVTQLQLLLTLGDARQQLGESDEAVRSYRQALELARTSLDSQHEAITLYKLGSAQLDSGDTDTAIDNLEQALALFKAQKRREYEGRVLGALGSAYGDLERWSEAINFHTSALYIAREVGDTDDEALQLTSLGYANLQANQLGQALLRYRQALHLAYESNNRNNIVATLVDLVRLLLRSPRHLRIAELLIDDALNYESYDKDVRQLKDRVMTEIQAAQANGTSFVQVNGTAEDYAENAYDLLEA